MLGKIGKGLLGVICVLCAAATPALAASTGTADAAFTNYGSAAATQYGGGVPGVLGSGPQRVVACVSHRTFVITLPREHLRRGERIVSLTLARDRGIPRHFRPSLRRLTVSLAGLVGVHTVRIVVTARTSRHRVFRRVSLFHTCVPGRRAKAKTGAFSPVRRSSFTLAARGSSSTAVMLLLAALSAGAVALAMRRGVRRLRSDR